MPAIQFKDKTDLLKREDYALSRLKNKKVLKYLLRCRTQYPYSIDNGTRMIVFKTRTST